MKKMKLLVASTSLILAGMLVGCQAQKTAQEGGAIRIDNELQEKLVVYYGGKPYYINKCAKDTTIPFKNDGPVDFYLLSNPSTSIGSMFMFRDVNEKRISTKTSTSQGGYIFGVGTTQGYSTTIAPRAKNSINNCK